MGEPEVGRVSVVVVLGPGIQDDVVEHTRRVFQHFGIPFLEMGWGDFPDFLAGDGARRLRVVVFATGMAYTDEHIRLPEEINAQIIRLITDPEPPQDQLLTSTPFMATAGFGVQGAINAGQLAARILATTDAALRDLLQTKPYLTS